MTLPTATPGSGAASLRARWSLDPKISFLNHGSFGGCPRPVLESQTAWRDRMERQPVAFFARDLEGLIDEARERVAAFVGADPLDLVFVPNATTGVNAVLRSLRLEAGDEALVTDQEYNATRCAAQFVAEQAGARLVRAEIPFPIDSPETALQRVLDAVTERTRIVVIDHATSQTALIMPVEELARELRARGVDLLIDGAHAPGMIDLNVDSIGAPFYTANLHKWCCAPKGAAFLYVRRDRQADVVPTAVSHGWDAPDRGRSRFHLMFDWPGTCDPTAWLASPRAIEFMEGLTPNGWEGVRAHNHDLIVRGRRLLCEALGVEEPAPASMLGSIASVPLPDGEPGTPTTPFFPDPLQHALLERHGIEVPVIHWPEAPKRLLRISAQVYNEMSEYERLAEALRRELGAGL